MHKEGTQPSLCAVFTVGASESLNLRDTGLAGHRRKTRLDLAFCPMTPFPGAVALGPRCPKVEAPQL